MNCSRNKILILLTGMIIFLAYGCMKKQQPHEGQTIDIAQTPPMGWNSWDCFGVDVTESEVKHNADYMAEHLMEYGWEYIVVDILWYGGPDIKVVNYKEENPDQRIDEYGRLLPAENRFPSAAEGSFKAVAQYIHSKGLKFGLHLMRGIPWQAVEQNTPILGTDYHARDIVNYQDTLWYDGTYGIDMDKPGSQEYYNSVMQLMAEWEVDYVKVDNISNPYYKTDIEAVRLALDNCGRPMVLSLSPGEPPREMAGHLGQHADLWRVSDDFWDDWKFLYEQFERGEFLKLREWLRNNIHKHGRKYRATKLCEKVTCKPLDYKPLIAYMNANTAKYTVFSCRERRSAFLTTDEKQ